MDQNEMKLKTLDAAARFVGDNPYDSPSDRLERLAAVYNKMARLIGLSIDQPEDSAS
jgi:hypothetical protein